MENEELICNYLLAQRDLDLAAEKEQEAEQLLSSIGRSN